MLPDFGMSQVSLKGNQVKAALQECTFRKVWEDDGIVQRVEVEQSATAFFKTIYTRMHVVQVSPKPPVATLTVLTMLYTVLWT